MTAPIVVEFDASCTPDHAFSVWTSRLQMWWPKAHTVSQDQVRDIVFEPFEGGRIFERDADGVEHLWGEIVVWDPPHRVDYLWHIFFESKDATDISVTFTPSETGVHVKLVQSGFDRLPVDIGAGRRDRVEGVWHQITGLYREALV